jgi:hypothetical protein
MVGPGVVPRHSNFKNLICQTGLSAITGAKDFLLCCKTENNHNAQTALRDGDLLSAGVLRSARNPWALARSVTQQRQNSRHRAMSAKSPQGHCERGAPLN